MSAMAGRLCTVTDRLVAAVARLAFGPPVACVYNPLEYARAMYDAYVARYARASCEVVLLGMNPGPWGMAQTGVPFGEVRAVRDWLELDAPIGRPRRAHPRRPVLGLNCPRSEVSGVRFWGWARATFGSPRAFFKRFFVANYCPLCFMEESGRNRTPDKLPMSERDPLLAACDEALARTVDVLRPRCVVGVGGFAEARVRAVLASRRSGLRVGRILHPSPASPAANRNWAATVTAQLRDLGIDL